MISANEQRAIEAFARKVGSAVGAATEEAFQKRVFFTVILGTYGADGFMTYVSSGEREGMIQAMRELAAKVEADTRKTPREYVRRVEVPQRFQLERVEDAVLRGASLQVEEVPGGANLLVAANGRLAGVLVLSAAEERALKARLFREEEG